MSLEHSAQFFSHICRPTLIDTPTFDPVKALAQMEAQDNDLYGYVPTKGITLMFIILFGISTCECKAWMLLRIDDYFLQ